MSRGNRLLPLYTQYFFYFFCLVPGLAEVKIKEEEKIEGGIGVTVTALVLVRRKKVLRKMREGRKRGSP